MWKPLSLMLLAGLTPSDWDITIIDENLGAPDYRALPRPDLVGNLSYRRNLQLNLTAYADFKTVCKSSPPMSARPSQIRFPKREKAN